MTSEELEFQISQYVDDTLSPLDRQQVDDRVLADPAARKLLADFQQLDAYLLSSQRGLNLNWDRLAQHFSAAVDDQISPAVVGRIGFARSRWSIAAGLLLALTAVLIGRHEMQERPSNLAPLSPLASVVVAGPQADVAQGPRVEEVKIGPSPAIANADWRFGEGVVGRGPARVTILGALSPSVKHDANRQ